MFKIKSLYLSAVLVLMVILASFDVIFMKGTAGYNLIILYLIILSLSLYVMRDVKVDKNNLYYLWRWVDNDNPVVRQVQLGTISNHTISFINSPIVGAVIRNAPTILRKATGFYCGEECQRSSTISSWPGRQSSRSIESI